MHRAALREVAEYLAGQNLAVDVDSVTFTQQFPRCVPGGECAAFAADGYSRKVFTRAEFAKSLRELGLTPSAVRRASRSRRDYTCSYSLAQVLIAS